MKKLTLIGLFTSIALVLSGCAANTGTRQEYFGYSKAKVEVNKNIESNQIASSSQSLDSQNADLLSADYQSYEQDYQNYYIARETRYVPVYVPWWEIYYDGFYHPHPRVYVVDYYDGWRWRWHPVYYSYWYDYPFYSSYWFPYRYNYGYYNQGWWHSQHRYVVVPETKNKKKETYRDFGPGRGSYSNINDETSGGRGVATTRFRTVADELGITVPSAPSSGTTSTDIRGGATRSTTTRVNPESPSSASPSTVKNLNPGSSSVNPTGTSSREAGATKRTIGGTNSSSPSSNEASTNKSPANNSYTAPKESPSSPATSSPSRRSSGESTSKPAESSRSYTPSSSSSPSSSSPSSSSPSSSGSSRSYTPPSSSSPSSSSPSSSGSSRSSGASRSSGSSPSNSNEGSQRGRR